jgi:hypothetical protein
VSAAHESEFESVGSHLPCTDHRVRMRYPVRPRILIIRLEVHRVIMRMIQIPRGVRQLPPEHRHPSRRRRRRRGRTVGGGRGGRGAAARERRGSGGVQTGAWRRGRGGHGGLVDTTRSAETWRAEHAQDEQPDPRFEYPVHALLVCLRRSFLVQRIRPAHLRAASFGGEQATRAL